LSESEKTVFVWVSKKISGPTQQPFWLQVTTAGSQKHFINQYQSCIYDPAYQACLNTPGIKTKGF